MIYSLIAFALALGLFAWIHCACGEIAERETCEVSCACGDNTARLIVVDAPDRHRMAACLTDECRRCRYRLRLNPKSTANTPHSTFTIPPSREFAHVH